MTRQSKYRLKIFSSNCPRPPFEMFEGARARAGEKIARLKLSFNFVIRKKKLRLKLAICFSLYNPFRATYQDFLFQRTYFPSPTPPFLRGGDLDSFESGPEEHDLSSSQRLGSMLWLRMAALASRVPIGGANKIR